MADDFNEAALGFSWAFIPFSSVFSLVNICSQPNSFSFDLSSSDHLNSHHSRSMAASDQSTHQAADDVNINDAADISQLIQAHQEKAARLPPDEEIRTVLQHSLRGILSIFSEKHEGYPPGSMVDFACAADGSPILAISSMANHFQDLSENSKCSLLVAKDPEDRTDLIITLYGNAVAVSKEDNTAARIAYLAKHPNAFSVDSDDFPFMLIKPKTIRFATSLLRSGELSAEEYRAAQIDPIAQFSKPVSSHMNRDHGEDTKTIVRHWTGIPVDYAVMLDLDSVGFNVKAGYNGKTVKLRVPFPRPAEDRKSVKTLVIEMLQAAKPQV